MTTQLETSPVAKERNQSATRELRVLFYLMFPSRFSGLARYTHELLTRLAELPETRAELACAPSYHWRDSASYAVWPGLREISHPTALRRRARFAIAQFANPNRLWKHVARSQPDIVHFSNINALSYPVWRRAMRRSGAKVAATVHDVLRGRGIVSTRFENRQLRAFYREADALFVHGGAQRQLLEQIGIDPRRIHCIPHGPYDYGRPLRSHEETRKLLALPSDKQIVLFFGTAREEKNLDLLLRAASDFRESLHVIVAGEIPSRARKNRNYYRDLIEQLALRENVTLLPQRIPDEQVADLFEVCDWVALPYAKSFSSQSGVLNVAAAYSRPCLASETGAMGEALSRFDIGVLIKPDDLDSLKGGIRQMIARVAGNYRHNFDGYRAHFSWEAAARETLRVYQSLLE